MARLLPSLLAALMLLAGPALCLGGLLEHACEGCDAGVEADCEHEESCADDPCTSLASVLPERGVRAEPDAAVQAVPIAVLAPEVAAQRPRGPQPGALPEPPPHRWRLPYALSDRPLLL